MIPQTWVELSDAAAQKKMQKILDLLDEDDDVQNVYHSWDVLYQKKTKSKIVIH